MKLKILNFILKHKIDLDATYFKLHLTIIKFPTLEISREWGGGFTCPIQHFWQHLFMLQGVAA